MRTQTIPVDGTDLLVTIHYAEPEVGFCLIVHGFGEHSGRYDRMVEFLVSRGMSTATYDLRGHGRSPGRAGRATVSRHVLDNLEVRDTLFTHMSERPGAQKGLCVMIGHSMGGLVVAESAVRRPWHLGGIVLSSPALVVAKHAPAPLRAVAPAIAAALPFLPVSRIDPDDVSRDPAVREAYEKDPNVYHLAVPAAAGATMLADGTRMLERCRGLPMPMLVVAGDADKITDVSGARRFAENAGSLHDPRPEVTYREFPGGYHELFNDLCREEAYAVLGDWLDSLVYC